MQMQLLVILSYHEGILTLVVSSSIDTKTVPQVYFYSDKQLCQNIANWETAGHSCPTARNPNIIMHLTSASLHNSSCYKYLLFL